jgi:hypothetical protein
MNAKSKLLTFTFVVVAFFLFFGMLLAYITNESAGVVVGQTGFTSATSGLTANTLALPPGVAGAGTTLFILDSNNNRVLAKPTLCPTQAGQRLPSLCPFPMVFTWMPRRPSRRFTWRIPIMAVF